MGKGRPEGWGGRTESEWADRLGVAHLELHRRIESTSARARDGVRRGVPTPAVIVAERQSAGRGRRGRRWWSDSPLGLWVTVAIARAGAPVPVAPLRAGLAVARGLEAVVPELQVRVKWPNDLLLGRRKVGGVLCEGVGETLLVGVGVNLNHAAGDLPEVEPPATSVLAATGRETPRGRALSAIVRELLAAWRSSSRALAPGELSELSARSALGGRRLRVDGVVGGSRGAARAVRALTATAVAVAPDGALEVVDDAGRSLRVLAGSIRIGSRALPDRSRRC